MTRRSFSKICSLISLLLLASGSVLRAQLAITEVMSSASQNLGPVRVTSRPDFWELTNFGTNTVELTNYRFSDSAGIQGAEAAMFNGRSIRGGESIIFFQTNPGVCTNAAQFRDWWGTNNVSADLQIYTYAGFGFSSTRDAVQLWQVTLTKTNLVDRIELYEARRGSSFTYDSTTGVLDALSVPGIKSAFKATETDDVGSPGRTIGRVPLAITKHPQEQTVDGGAPAVFDVVATGLPRPRFQWRFNGEPIEGATSSSYEIPATTPSHEGSYSVELDNGLETRPSQSAVLRVNTTLTPPSNVVGPVDLTIAPQQEAQFQVWVRGFELPTFQWQFENVDIPDATNRIHSVSNADMASSGTYTVQIRNSLGSTSASAVLTVQPLPKLVVTEIMGSRAPSTNTLGRADWWELTNFDTYAVNLRGYRFDDFPGIIDGSVVITNEVIVRPGESVLFIQDITPETFTTWWGEENLPAQVQFVRYAGNGFNALGDALTLWNSTPKDRLDYVHQALYAQDLNPDFTPIGGPSRTFYTQAFEEFGRASVIGEYGAIRAFTSDDVGSPGYITNHPPRTLAPRGVDVTLTEPGVQLLWRTQIGKRYELQSKVDLNAVNWTTLSQHTASGASLVTHDPLTEGRPRRFYRLVVVMDPP